MKLIGQELIRLGIPFMSVKARHNVGSTAIVEVVCERDEDAVAADVALQGFGDISMRVATPEELVEWQRWQE